MSRYEDNIYYHPESNGLRVIKSGDVGEMYEFDMVVLFQDIETGQYLIGADSGCSCPSPFEDVTAEDLVAVTTLAEVNDYLRRQWISEYYVEHYPERVRETEVEIAEFLSGLSL